MTATKQAKSKEYAKPSKKTLAADCAAESTLLGRLAEMGSAQQSLTDKLNAAVEVHTEIQKVDIDNFLNLYTEKLKAYIQLARADSPALDGLRSKILYDCIVVECYNDIISDMFPHDDPNDKLPMYNPIREKASKLHEHYSRFREFMDIDVDWQEGG